VYGVDVSDGLISEVTASIQDDVRAWQSRPLEELYVVVYLDALQVVIRDQQVVRKKAVYSAIGVTVDGERDVLGLWIEKTEGARFWTSVLIELRNRGVKDVLFVCTDGLTGFLEAIDAVFPEAVNQTCVVHLVRQSVALPVLEGAQELRRRAAPPLHAADADQARRVLEELTAAWAGSSTKTAALQVWERAWDRFIPFLAFPQEIRRVVYTTNTVESLHMQIRKTIPRPLPQRRRRAQTDLARNHARQDQLAHLLQLDASDGCPTHPLRRPHPQQHPTTHRYTEKRAGSDRGGA
jgi:putative transposase